MDRTIVRIKSISIHDFKNVKKGDLLLENPRNQYASSVLGLYGQNGSGKTALIDAISLLKIVLCGQTIPAFFGDYINIDSDYAAFRYAFSVKKGDENYDVVYKFNIKIDPDKSVDNISALDFSVSNRKLTLFDEILSYSFSDKSNSKRMSNLIYTGTEDVSFSPKTKYEILTGKHKEVETDLLVAKKLAAATSKSFIFSNDFMEIVKNYCTSRQERLVLDSLIRFGNFGLFVIDTKNSGLISLDALPLSVRYSDQKLGLVKKLMLPLDESAIIPKSTLSAVKNIIHSMNIVLSQIVPGLTIDMVELGTQLLGDNSEGCKVQLMSNKNSKQIPLQYESEGIKKIISILQLLVVIYNDPSVTVAIDELDAGIFEYLLGELLSIISAKGKGQLIFTSHNLRPLETIDKGFIAFATTNPENRYIRLSNVQRNNNLRDFYYRDIILGEQNEILYEQTNNYEIALAFRKAGDLIGS